MIALNEQAAAQFDLDTLVEMFFPDPARLGRFTLAPAEELPKDYRQLLAHENHMTVTVERYHGAVVSVEVLEKKQVGDSYARKILLRRQNDNRVVQFGLMRIDLNQVPAAAREEIVNERKPLGRILIENDVLREVHLRKLWRVEPGEELRHWLDSAPGEITYGRTALIDCNHRPAVELLEIVSVVEGP